MLRVCHRVLRDADEAREVAQTAMLEIQRSLGRFEGRSAWSTWVYQVTLNVARGYLRGKQRQRELDGDGPLERVPARELPPPESLERTALADVVRRALATLPAAQREALVLRQQEELSYAEIAALTGCPVGTVKSRIHNALVALGRRLEEME